MEGQKIDINWEGNICGLPLVQESPIYLRSQGIFHGPHQAVAANFALSQYLRSCVSEF